MSTVDVVSWKQLSSGRDITCGIASDDAGYCWGTFLPLC